MILLITFFIVIPLEAQAYIDPGSGSFFLQMLIAGIAGSVFYFRRFFSKLLFWKKNNSNIDSPSIHDK